MEEFTGGWLSGSCSDPSGPVGEADRILMISHTPRRPDWDCHGCGEPWPCIIARVTLSLEVADLRETMTAYLAEARVDLIDANAGELYARFLAWMVSGSGSGRAVGLVRARRHGLPAMGDWPRYPNTRQFG